MRYLRPMVPLARRSLVSKLRHPTTLLSDFLAPLMLVAVFTVLVAVGFLLTLIGALFRGPEWSWVWPWHHLYLEL